LPVFYIPYTKLISRLIIFFFQPLLQIGRQFSFGPGSSVSKVEDISFSPYSIEHGN
jgi:hypothetical protein